MSNFMLKLNSAGMKLSEYKIYHLINILFHNEHFNNNQIRNAMLWNSVLTLVTAHNTHVEQKTF